jgi:hypothetical protein
MFISGDKYSGIAFAVQKTSTIDRDQTAFLLVGLLKRNRLRVCSGGSSVPAERDQHQ